MSVYDNLVGMEEVLDDFIVETTELLEEVNEELIDLEADPNPDMINRIFRAFHTFKGTCGFLGFEQAKDVAHVAEDLLNAMRNNELVPSAPIIDLLLEACDWFSQFTEDVKERAEKEYDIASLIERLAAVRKGEAVTQPAAAAPAEAIEEPAAAAPQAAAGADGESHAKAEASEPPSADGNGQTVADDTPSTGAVYKNMDGMEEILEEFVIETIEILENVNEDLVQLEAGGDPELVNRIFRAFHTFKGTCGFLGFSQAKDVAHLAENLLNKMREGKLTPDGVLTDALLKTCDWFSLFIEDVKGRVDTTYDTTELLGLLKSIDEQNEAGAGPEPAVGNGAAGAPAKEAEMADNGQASAGTDGQASTTAAPAAEAAVTKPAAPAPTPTKKAEKPADEKAVKTTSQTIRVDMERLENLMNLAGELVLNRNQLGQAYSTLAKTKVGDQAIDHLDQVNNALGRITNEIQEAVMQMRMLPISNVFRKFPRVIRDLARDRGKLIELQLEGEETELDRSVIEAISDPLLHLVRNAADHGIEPPEVRLANGKPEVGIVTLRAAHQGNHIVIEVEDDGAGMDGDVLAEKAVGKGIITVSEAEAYSTREKLNLIFKPGFSTAAEVTDVSGRGVGMDVAYTNISKLNGVIDIDTKLGEGTRIIIKLPLTLAIVTGLKVGVWGENYIIPFGSIIETIKLQASDLTKVEDKWVIRFRDSVVNTLFLDEWFKVPSPENKDELEHYAVIVSVAQFRYALVVTAMKGQEEAVIKPLGQSLGRIPGVAGGTIGGDGEITLILDVPELIHHMGLG